MRPAPSGPPTPTTSPDLTSISRPSTANRPGILGSATEMFRACSATEPIVTGPRSGKRCARSRPVMDFTSVSRDQSERGAELTISPSRSTLT